MLYFKHAWNVERRRTVAIINGYYEHGFTSNRITRKDKGHTLINSEKKTFRIHTFLCVEA